MVATITIYVNTIVIMAMAMTMTEPTTRIMTKVLTKTRIMAVVAPTTMTKIFKQVQQDNFYCLVKMIKKATKNQPTKLIGSTCTVSQKSLFAKKVLLKFASMFLTDLFYHSKIVF